MEEISRPDEESQDESLANVPPSSIADASVPFGEKLVAGIVLAGVAGIGVVLVSSAMTPTMGATRSSKLIWQQRQLEIEQAERDAQSDVDSNQ